MSVVAKQISWIHRWGGNAHCLARIARPDENGAVLVVVSELYTNSRKHALVADMPNVAAAVLREFAGELAEIDPATPVWIAHHGDFSSYDAFGAPESFTRVGLRWDGERYEDDLARHELLGREDARELLRGVELAPLSAAPVTIVSVRSIK